MNKKYIIKENTEIEKIIKIGNKKVTKYFIIYNIESQTSFNMYCISVSKKLGKAVIRNKLKRRIKDILMKNRLEMKRKYVIILRKEAVTASYNELKENLIKNIKGENK